MKNPFLIPPSSLEPNTDREATGVNNAGTTRVDRRTFLKRSGTATVATLIAFGAGIDLARASGGSGSGSCSHKVAGSPNNVLSYTSNLSWDGMIVRGMMTCYPAGGPTSSKSLAITGEGWKASNYPGGVVHTSTVQVSASIEQPNCDFVPEISPDPASNTYSAQLWYENTNEAFGEFAWIEKTWHIHLEIFDEGMSSHDAFVKAKIYIRRHTKRWGEGIPTTHVDDYSPTFIAQNLWVWKV